MKLATLRTANGTVAVRQSVDGFYELGYRDVGELLAQQDWRAAGAVRPSARVHPLADAELAPVVPQPGKIICAGLNYRSHLAEIGQQLPEYPTLFAKFAEALVGPNDDITLPPESSAADWEAELAVVIGRTVRRAGESAAVDAIAGFTIINDVSMRDWQIRTNEWLQGKTFEATTPLGPTLVTPDELPGGVFPSLRLTCRINGKVVQKADTSDLLFGPADLVRYVSTIMTLRPGDIIATGTPGGIGHFRDPVQYLSNDDVVSTEIDGIGHLKNTARTE
ncbi:fumarylacetoacetate hydrolase family protein [Nocardia rhamnosiphila]|uniref:fumarylacetoacetate hydrolase family protein n=1 Tax=Nocardia rhamnosiphila TaxID=426716 RepID=UPI0033CECCD4